MLFCYIPEILICIIYIVQNIFTFHCNSELSDKLLNMHCWFPLYENILIICFMFVRISFLWNFFEACIIFKHRVNGQF